MTATETKVNIQPLGDRVVLEMLEEDALTAGGIYIPDSAREKPMRGKVVAVGPGRMKDDGNRIPMNLTVGQIVLFSKYGGTEVKLGDHEYKIMEENQILGIIQ